MDKPPEKMTRTEVLAELAWRNAARAQMVGNLYPAVNDERVAALRRREREIEFPACLTCGETVNLAGSSRCNNCYEVETRLGRYLESAGGRDHVRNLLHDSPGGTAPGA